MNKNRDNDLKPGEGYILVERNYSWVMQNRIWRTSTFVPVKGKLLKTEGHNGQRLRFMKVEGFDFDHMMPRPGHSTIHLLRDGDRVFASFREAKAIADRDMRQPHRSVNEPGPSLSGYPDVR